MMKPGRLAWVRRTAGVFFIRLVAGCAAPGLVQVPRPVGPAPIAPSPLNTGRLVVYAAEAGFPGGRMIAAKVQVVTGDNTRRPRA